METLRAVSLQFLHHPHPTRRFLYRESVSSCRLAGSKATLLDLLCYEEAPEFLATNSGVREQSRYLAALDTGMERLRHGALDPGIIQECFEQLCPEANLPPVAAEQIMHHAVRTEGQHPLLQAGLLHGHFAIAEPCPVANDRMARLLSTLFLADRKGIKAPGLFLSPFFEKHAETYGRHLRSLAEGADPADWLAFFVEGARHQAVDTTHRIQALLGLMDRYRAIMVRQGKGTRSAFKVMEHLVNVPLFTARTLMEKAGMSAPTAQRSIRIWTEEGVIQELTGHRSGRIYLATDLFRLATEEWQANAA
ncbi:MAG TPA: hypothetical protein VJ486_11375 [Geothrix sp.]|nr:hypothetical protein [Geothrix sp.]